MAEPSVSSTQGDEAITMSRRHPWSVILVAAAASVAALLAGQRTSGEAPS